MTRLYLRAILLCPLVFGLSQAQEFEVADGLEVSSAIKPGLVTHPVAATLDDRGRLFVVEHATKDLTREELLEQRPGSIRLLTDTDRDGVFDEATTFADELTFPQGAFWIYESLYVMSPPSLWRFSDPDGDGIAEEREELATGFDFTPGTADLHGPFLHPNGRIFWCHGRESFAIPDNDTGDIMEEGQGARLWSSLLSGGEVEPFAGGGMDNPVEIGFTDEGEIIGTVNGFQTPPRRDALVHWVHGGVYPRRDQDAAIAGMARTGDLLPEIQDFGEATVSGLFRYRSGLLNSEWKDQWVVSHPDTAQITRTRLVRKGSGFITVETDNILEVLRSGSYLTDVLEDHNGDILVIDAARRQQGQATATETETLEFLGDIYRISRKNEPYRAPDYPAWKSMTSEAVSGFLDAPEPWIRDLAGLELAGRGDPAIPELKRILRSDTSSPEAKQNAVWTLAKLRFSESTDLILDALKDSDPGVRQAACNAISVTRTWQSVAANEPAEREFELERNRTISGALANLVRSDDPRVARQAAVALGRMAEFRSIGAILGRLGRVRNDRFLEHSLIYALIDIDHPETTRIGLDSENPATVSGALRALHEMSSGDLQVLDLLSHLESPNNALRKTAIEIAVQYPQWDAALANRFFEWEDYSKERIEVMKQVAGAFGEHPPMIDFLNSLFTTEKPEARELGVTLVAEAETIKLLPAWEPVLESYLTADSSEKLRLKTLKILARERGQRFNRELAALASDENLSPLARLKAVRALSPDKATLSATSFELLLNVFRSEKNSATRSEATLLLNQISLTGEQRIELAHHASDFSAGEISSLLQTIDRFRSEEEALAFATGLLESKHLEAFDAAEIEALFRPFPDALPDELATPAQPPE